jgi:NitT/TauT family transport system ATP-binding protein
MSRAGIVVELRQIGQAYGSHAQRFIALQRVDLSIYEGEFVALVGPTGCGKSTLLRIITGLQQPTEGQVLYRGVPVRGVNPHTTIVFQTFALFPWLTVQQNVELALAARGVPAPLRARRAEELLDKVGLDGYETAFPREVSGAMRQKVGFARALAVEPELLCLDEPFSALDVLSADSLRGELPELWTSGAMPTKAILLVTHNIEEAVLFGGPRRGDGERAGARGGGNTRQPAPPPSEEGGALPGDGGPGLRLARRPDAAGGRRDGHGPRRSGPHASAARHHHR